MPRGGGQELDTNIQSLGNQVAELDIRSAKMMDMICKLTETVQKMHETQGSRSP